MTTRIYSSGPTNGVTAGHTASRVTPAPAQPFRQVINAGAGAVVHGAEATALQLPGGPILAAAVRSPSAQTSEGAALTAEGSGGTGTLAAATGTASPGSPEAMLSQNADQNMYFLTLQERISAESRAYTALSNVLKARHDTVKNAIGNIR
jgi:hypothetical protein